MICKIFRISQIFASFLQDYPSPYTLLIPTKIENLNRSVCLSANINLYMYINITKNTGCQSIALTIVHFFILDIFEIYGTFRIIELKLKK